MMRSKNYFFVAVVTLCILLVLCVIPAMAANGEATVDTIYSEGVTTDVGYGGIITPNDTKAPEDTWNDVETETGDYEKPGENEIELVIEDMIIDDPDPYRNHRIPVYCQGGSASTFYMELYMPYFVEVNDVVFSDMLINAKNAKYEYDIRGNYLSVAYSSAEDFMNSELFYIDFYLTDILNADECIDTGYMQFVNSSVKEVWAYTNFGRIIVQSDIDILMGDANQDGVVNLEDVMFILRYKVHGYGFEEYGFIAADIDCNGCVDMIDCQYIQNYIVGAIDSLEDVNGSTEDDKIQEGEENEENCDHSKVIEYSRLDPTCQEPGYILYRCACGENETVKDIAPTYKHEYLDGKCSVCGALENESGEDSGDDPTIDEIKPDIPENDSTSDAQAVKYSYYDHTSSFCFYENGTFEGVIVEYTAEGTIFETKVDGKWDFDDISYTLIATPANYDSTMIFILNENGELSKK